MLDFIYYPVSWILWVWHKVFAAIPFLGPDSGWTWALSVVFLVFTLRAILYKPFVKQVRTTRQMQELQPQIKRSRRSTPRTGSAKHSRCRSSRRSTASTP